MPTAASASSLKVNPFGVRSCRYDPSASQAGPTPELASPSNTPSPYPTPTIPGGPPVDAQKKARQLEVFRGLWSAVNDNYVDPGFNGRDWAAIGARYRALVEGGLSDEAFYAILQQMIGNLGDEHSYFQSPAEVEEEARAVAGQLDFVGIGMLAVNAPDGGAVVISVFPDGPAAEAGLLPHDEIVAVDGGPPRDENGLSRTRGPEGTSVVLTVRTPGEAPREIIVTRLRVTGGLPVDSCLVPGTRLGYVMLPSFLDETVDDQLRGALKALTADSPLDGLILDNRMNGGGLGSVAEASLGMFLGGPQGAYVTRGRLAESPPGRSRWSGHGLVRRDLQRNIAARRAGKGRRADDPRQCRAAQALRFCRWIPSLDRDGNVSADRLTRGRLGGYGDRSRSHRPRELGPIPRGE
jgi:C-terminal processing protease CtpA/Prc